MQDLIPTTHMHCPLSKSLFSFIGMSLGQVKKRFHTNMKCSQSIRHVHNTKLQWHDQPEIQYCCCTKIFRFFWQQ